MPQRIAGIQILLTALCTASAAILGGGSGGLSALAGGAVACGPTLWFALVIERRGHATRSVKDAPRAILRAELGKWLMTASGFVVALAWLPTTEPVALFGAFAVCQLAYLAGAAGTGAGTE